EAGGLGRERVEVGSGQRRRLGDVQFDQTLDDRTEQRLPGAEVVRRGALGQPGPTVHGPVGEAPHAFPGQRGDRRVGDLGPARHGSPPQQSSTSVESSTAVEEWISMRAVIVGGGIGGLAGAVALTRQGWRVEILERAAELSEVGAGLSLWPNALRALDHLGLGDRVRARSSLGAQAGIQNAAGRWLARTDTAELERRYGPVAVLHRADL